MGRKDAEIVVSKMAQYESFFVGLMITEELGTPSPEDNDCVLLLDAFVMFISFAVFGCIPLLLYLLGVSQSLDGEELFECVAVVSIGLLCLLGMAKSTYSSSSTIYAVIESLGIGVSCSLVAFVIGSFVVKYLE